MKFTGFQPSRAHCKSTIIYFYKREQSLTHLVKVLLVKLSDILHSSNFVRLFHRQSFELYGMGIHNYHIWVTSAKQTFMNHFYWHSTSSRAKFMDSIFLHPPYTSNQCNLVDVIIKSCHYRCLKMEVVTTHYRWSSVCS